ncbi:FKBP-type peptidyl-prolyl cis-trans isomerase N-terminal domain-containing protein [Lysobacter xanthus]
MNLPARGLAALLALSAAAAVAAPPAAPASKPAPAASAKAASTVSSLSTPRQKVSYMIGMDVGQSLAPVAPDLDMAEFQRAIRNAFDGGKPLLTQEQAQKLGPALMKRIAARRGQAPAGEAVPEVSKQQVGLLVGADVGGSLAPVKDEIDFAVMMQAITTSFANGTPLLGEAERTAVREQFTTSMRDKMQARAAAQATTNRDAGAKFLLENKAKKGVFTTPSGLQYMVLRQGSGPRPKPTDRVRVNYHGTLLDGTVFDSSYDRGAQPVEFMLNQVIPGWTEGVSMMPVGAKYRFWIPSDLAYGEKGAGPQIGPNSTLVFDVELLAISP